MAVPITKEPLDARLVDVALDLLARDGIESLTLRRIARDAGVSHGAPLRHYRSLATLLAHVAARGFRMLQEAVGTAASALPEGSPPGDALAAACRAYVETAVAHPDLFALMFRPEQLDWQVPALQANASAAFEQLVGFVAAAQEAGWHPEADTRVLAGANWAAAHGLATLWAQGAMQGVTDNRVLDDAIAMTIEVLSGAGWSQSSPNHAPTGGPT